MVGGIMKIRHFVVVDDIAGFEKELCEKLKLWWYYHLGMTKYCDIEEDIRHHNKELMNELFEMHIFNRADIRQLCLEGKLTKKMLYNSIMSGFDICTECGAYVELHDYT